MLSLWGRWTPHCAQTTINSGSGSTLGGLGAGRCARFFQTHQITATRAMSRRYFIMEDPESIDANRGKQHGLSGGFNPGTPVPRTPPGTQFLPLPDQRTPINQQVILQQNHRSRKEKRHCRPPDPFFSAPGSMTKASPCSISPRRCGCTIAPGPATRKPPPEPESPNRAVTNSGRLFLSARSGSRPGLRRRR